VPGVNYQTVLELAQKRGMKVGDVSTAEITDATPAVLASHMSLRGCQGPANMAACSTETKAAAGLGSIAEQEVDHKVDVLLGGGARRGRRGSVSAPRVAPRGDRLSLGGVERRYAPAGRRRRRVRAARTLSESVAMS